MNIFIDVPNKQTKIQPCRSFVNLTFLDNWFRLCFIVLNRMKHDLNWVLRIVRLMTFAPIIRYGVGEYGAISVECGGRDRSIDRRIAFETMLCILVPSRELVNLRLPR